MLTSFEIKNWIAVFFVKPVSTNSLHAFEASSTVLYTGFGCCCCCCCCEEEVLVVATATADLSPVLVVDPGGRGADETDEDIAIFLFRAAFVVLERLLGLLRALFWHRGKRVCRSSITKYDSIGFSFYAICETRRDVYGEL